MSVWRLLRRFAWRRAYLGGRGWCRALCAAAAVLLTPHAASAQTTFSVSSDPQLRAAIRALSAGDSIVFAGDITLAADLAPIAADNVTIDGRGFALSGDRRYQGLVVGTGGSAVTVYVNDLTIRDVGRDGVQAAVPGHGGGLVIGNAASVFVSGVSVTTHDTSGGGPASAAEPASALFIAGGNAGAGVSGGRLIIVGALTIDGQTVGNGAGSPAAGAGVEGSGTVLFRPSNNQTTTIADPIVDARSASGVSDGSALGLDLFGAGRLVLRGDNRYSGGTSIDGGSTLNVLTAANLGTGSVTVERGGTLEIAGSGAFNNRLLVDATGRVSVGAGQTATWNGHVANEHTDGRIGALLVAGSGTLVLTDATNDYSAGTAVVDDSTLSVRADGALGRANTPIGLGDARTRGTLGITGSFTTARPVTLGAGGGVVDVAAGVDAALAGAIDGTGGLTKAGSGSLALSGPNTYGGPTSIAAGTLRAGAANVFGTSGTMSIGGGATLDLNNFDYTFDTVSGDGTVALGTATLTTGGTGSATLNGAVTGAGALVKQGTGTFTLGGANSYSGGTFVRGGTLAGTTSSLQGAIADDAAVAFVQNGDGVYAGAITGTGALVKAGSGTVTLIGRNTYSGGTTVSKGTLAGNTTSLQGTIVDNAHVAFEQEQDGTFAGAISGSGRLSKTGGGALTLTGANTYAGGTVVQAGSLVGDSRSVQGAIANEATVIFDQGADGTYGGDMSGSGRLIKNGAGALTLSGVNGYTGGTTVAAGTLIGDVAALHGDIVNQSSVVFDQHGDAAYAGNMSGAGRLTKTGPGRLLLTGSSTYTGGTFVNEGTLAGDTTTLRGALSVNGGQLEFDQREDGILRGSLAGGGAIAKSGTGRLFVSDASSLSGMLTVLQGGVTLNGPMAGSAAIRSGADFTLNGSMRGTVVVDPGASFLGLGSVGGLTVGGSWAVPAIATSGPALARRAAIPNAAVTSTAPRFVVNGDLTTTPGSTVALEVHDAQAPVQVNGAASFTGTQFNIVVDDTSKTRLESYPLVKADAVSLASSTVSAQTSTLAPVLFADPTTLRVSVLNLLVPLSAVPTTKNGRAIATAIDTLKPATGEMRALIRNLAGLEDQSLRAAFDQMTGQVNTTNARMVVMDSEAITDLIRAEMSRDAESELEIGSGSGRSGMWVEAVGAHARFSATGDLSGAVVNLGGLAGGYDLLRGDRFTFGGGLSFTSGDLSLDSLKEASQMSAPRGFAYAGVRVGPFRFHGGGSAAKTNTTSTREIHIQQGDPNRDPGAAAFDATAQAERNGNANDAWSEWQDTFRIKSWTTESKVGWRHARFARQAFTEQGGGPVSLQSSGSTLTLTESDVLVRTFKRSGQYRPYFMFTYRRSFGDPSNSEDSQFVNQPTATFAVQGLPMATNTVMGRTGLTVHLGVGLEFTLEYEFRRAEFETRHTVDFRVRMR